MELLVATALARAAIRDAERLTAARGDADMLAPACETARRNIAERLATACGDVARGVRPAAAHVVAPGVAVGLYVELGADEEQALHRVDGVVVVDLLRELRGEVGGEQQPVGARQGRALEEGRRLGGANVQGRARRSEAPHLVGDRVGVGVRVRATARIRARAGPRARARVNVRVRVRVSGQG